MTMLLCKMRIFIVALAVAGALGFGASAALAKVPECQDPVADTACASDADCRSQCQRMYGPNTHGNCNESTACCYCIPD